MRISLSSSSSPSSISLDDDEVCSSDEDEVGVSAVTWSVSCLYNPCMLDICTCNWLFPSFPDEILLTFDARYQPVQQYSIQWLFVDSSFLCHFVNGQILRVDVDLWQLSLMYLCSMKQWAWDQSDYLIPMSEAIMNSLVTGEVRYVFDWALLVLLLRV